MPFSADFVVAERMQDWVIDSLKPSAQPHLVILAGTKVLTHVGGRVGSYRACPVAPRAWPGTSGTRVVATIRFIGEPQSCPIAVSL